MCKLSKSDFDFLCGLLEASSREFESVSCVTDSVLSSYANRIYSQRCKDILERLKSTYKED